MERLAFNETGVLLLQSAAIITPSNILYATYNQSNSGETELINGRVTDLPFSQSTVTGPIQEGEVGSLGFGIPDTVFARKVVHYCFGTLLTLFGLAGLLGNGLVLYVFARYRRLRGGGGPLILSLASGDCMVSFLHFMPAYSSFKEDWSFGDWGCDIYAASVGIGGLASLITLSVIAADRFSVIMGNPIQWISGKKACVAIWIFSFLLVLPPFIGWSRFVREGLNTSCSWDYASRTWNNRSYYIYLLTFGFILPVTAVIMSYIGILIVICQHSTKMNGVTRNGITHSKRRPTKSDLRTAQIVLTIIICFLASWTPYALVSLFYQFGPGNPYLSPLAVALPAVFAKASVVYNPIVYGLSHPHFRSAVRMLKARHLGGRHCGPHDRYHYQYTTAGMRGKKPLLVTRSRCHNDLKGLQDKGSTSRHGHELTTDAQTTTKTFEFSPNSYDEGFANRKGWTFLKMHSRGPESGYTFGTSLGQDEGISSVLESTSYSEPDRLDQEDQVRITTGYEACEYRRRKKILDKSIFHSENCLSNLLRLKDSESGTTFPDTSKVNSNGGAGATIKTTTTLVSLNSRGGTTCLTAKKKEILSIVGERGVAETKRSIVKCPPAGMTKTIGPMLTSNSSHSSKPFMRPPDPHNNSSRALRLTLSKSDDSFSRSTFWFLRQRACGKGSSPCQLKRAKCIRGKRRQSGHKKRPSAPLRLIESRLNGSNSSSSAYEPSSRASSGCLECSLEEKDKWSQICGHADAHHHYHHHHCSRISESESEINPVSDAHSNQQVTLLARTTTTVQAKFKGSGNSDSFQSELLPNPSEMIRVPNQANNYTTNKSRLGLGSSVVNFVKFAARSNRKGASPAAPPSSSSSTGGGQNQQCPTCQLLQTSTPHAITPNSYSEDNSNDMALSYNTFYHQYAGTKDFRLADGFRLGSSGILTTGGSLQMNVCENPFNNYYHENTCSDGGSDTFYSCS